MKTLVFATNNQHKLNEVQEMVGSNFKLQSLKDIGCVADIPETGITFEENASQKSRYIFDHFQMDCFSDDSGLEIDALNDEPGVYSAHYSGSRDTEANMQLVLEKLGNNEHRAARFRCVISLILNGEEYFFEGSVEGSIATGRSGKAGFGYDPIFKPEGFDQTFSEMTGEEKNKISHRGKAMAKLVAFLSKLG
jgi:XTP/dITP diphosphohydrolase